MYSAPKHSAARKCHPTRNRLAGLTLVVSAALATVAGQTPSAQAAGSAWDSVAACESGGNWAINTGNGYYGGLQFSAQTWRAYGGARYGATANRASKSNQIAIARRVLVAQGPQAWPVCSIRAGLTRADGANGVNRANGARGAGGVTVSRSVRRVAITRLVVDGRMGPKTIRATQRWVGAPRTGVFGPLTAKALQRWVHVAADGAIGPRTIRALQVTIGAGRDGARSLNPATVAALQRYLNRH